MWPWNRRENREGFPPDFVVQRIRNTEAKAVSHLTASEIAAFFLQNPSVAEELLIESLDKRFSPSTFLSEDGDQYSVGWFSRTAGFQCEKRFTNVAHAATDYVLFSLGKGRWTPPQA
jgi:hypothetical protein